MDSKEEIYAATRQDLLTRLISNSESFDKYVLTLSVAVLSILITFLRDIVPSGEIKVIYALWGSLFLFGGSIAFTMISFLVSQQAIKVQLHYAEKYYLNKKEEFLNKKNSWAQATSVLNWISAAFFVIAIGCTICFTTLNLIHENESKEKTMSEKLNIDAGTEIPAMQEIPSGVRIMPSGQIVPDMQPVPPPPKK